MPLIYIDEETKAILDEHKDVIKDIYITNKLFIDSVVRSRLRNMNYLVGEELILTHLKYLRAKKARHTNKRRLARLIERHQNRINISKARLGKVDK